MCHPRAHRVSLSSRFDDCVMQSLQHRELVNMKESYEGNNTKDVVNDMIKELADHLKDFKTMTPMRPQSTTMLEDRKSRTVMKYLFEDNDHSQTLHHS